MWANQSPHFLPKLLQFSEFPDAGPRHVAPAGLLAPLFCPMDFLKAEIQRKRKATEELKREAVQGAAKPKFVRRGDLERVRTERVLAEERERRKQEEERKQRDAEELARQRERLERMTQAMSTKGNSSQGAAGANVASTDAPLAAGAVSVPGQGKPSASAASSAEGASEQHAAAGSAAGQAAAAAAGGADGAEAPLPKLPRTEVARRLRLHGEPITCVCCALSGRLAACTRDTATQVLWGVG